MHGLQKPPVSAADLLSLPLHLLTFPLYCLTSISIAFFFFLNPPKHQRALEKCFSSFLKNNTHFEFLFFICFTLIILQRSTITTSGKASVTLWSQFLLKNTQNCVPVPQSTFYTNDILHRVNIMIICWTSDIYTISSQIRRPNSGFAYQFYL